MAVVVVPMTAGEPIAGVWRGGILECIHSGHVRVENPDGQVALQRGDDVEFFPRSSLKPFQALAALKAGAHLTDEQLALACASHAGTPEHVQVAQSVLDSLRLTRADLLNTPDFPLDDVAAAAVHAEGGEKEPIFQNCSGKHAAMLASCTASGWDTTTYLDHTHPLQVLIRDTLEELTQTQVRWSIDGCGAPTATTSLSGLARAMRTLVTAEEGTLEHRISRAMRTHPHLISGHGRFDTLAMQNVPGIVVKGGADGVLMAGFPDGATIITQVADGNHRANTPTFMAAMNALGVDADLAWAQENVYGHGRVVGTVEWIK